MKDNAIRILHEVRVEPDYKCEYPPTVQGLAWAVKQWEPILQDDKPSRIFHDVRIEEGENFTCYITALIEPALLEGLMKNEVEDFTSEEAIGRRLAEYLEQWRPVCVCFKVQVLALQPTGKAHPYR